MSKGKFLGGWRALRASRLELPGDRRAAFEKAALVAVLVVVISWVVGGGLFLVEKAGG
jgi:hypothetical protein